MKCQCLFSRKNKKNISSRLNFLPSIQSVMVSLGRYPTVLQDRRLLRLLICFSARQVPSEKESSTLREGKQLVWFRVNLLLDEK